MPYNPTFINGNEIPLPVPNKRIKEMAFNGAYVHHSRYSILFNEKRGFAFVSAHNIDGATLSKEQYTSRNFKKDPKITPKRIQIGNDRGYRESKNGVYGPNPWDRGHLARRKSLSWGNKEQASIAERESDFYSNITPQHENLHDDAWGKIEDWMLNHVQGGNQRACVFTGPVFTEDDPEHTNGPNEKPIRIPAGFWKIISIELNGVMRSAGFLVWQRDYDNVFPLPFAPVLEQVRLTTIEVLTGLSFPSLRLFDPLLFDQQGNLRERSVSIARESLREQMLKPLEIGSLQMDSNIEKTLLFESTSPGTSIITSMRDIVL